MSEPQEKNVIDNATEFEPTTQPSTADTEALITNIAPVTNPLETEDTTKEDQSGNQDLGEKNPIDPITGDDYTNTSNGNQVAVLSTIDYSTDLNVYNTSATTQSHNTTNYQTVNNNYYCRTSSESTKTASPTPMAEVDQVTGSSQLQREAIHYKFTSREYFSRRGVKRVDRIYEFSSSNGDILELSREVFRGIDSLELAIASNGKEVKKMAKRDIDLIYNDSSGELFFNANGGSSGFGRSGGMFAILEDAPLISSANLILI